jgi:hypothetical protein
MYNSNDIGKIRVALIESVYTSYIISDMIEYLKNQPYCIDAKYSDFTFEITVDPIAVRDICVSFEDRLSDIISKADVNKLYDILKDDLDKELIDSILQHIIDNPYIIYSKTYAISKDAVIWISL